MSEFTLKYRLRRKAAQIFKYKKAPNLSADELREKYRKTSRVIPMMDKAFSPKLEYERRFEHGCLSTFITRKDSTKALLYIPDTQMLKFPDGADYVLFEELALKTGRDVIIPHYPLCIECSMNEAVDMVYKVYKSLVSEYGAGNVAAAGCSSGGTLALALISHINELGENIPMPDKLYVSSPEMCIYSQEERERAKQLEKTDICLTVKWLDTFYDLITNGRELPKYMTYPQLGNYSGLKDAYICFADCEVLYAMCGELEAQMKSAGVDVTLEAGKGMYHGYPVMNTVKDAYLGHFNMISYLADRVTSAMFDDHTKVIFGKIVIRLS